MILEGKLKPWFDACITILRIPLVTPLIVGLVLSTTPLRFFAFVIIIYVGARLLPLSIGLIGKVVAAYLMIASANCIIAGVAWLLKLQLTSGLLLSILLFTLLVTVMFMHSKKIRLPAIPKLWMGDDLVAVAVAVAALVILFLPVFPRPNANTLAPVVIAGGDNSAHIEMLKTNDFNRGYSIGTDNRFNMASNLYAYSQGWHFNGAFVKWLIESFVYIGSSPSRILALFYTYSAVWFAILVFLMTRLSLMVASINGKRKGWSRIAAALICSLGVAGWVLPLFASGFEPQIGSLALFLLEILFLLEAYDRPADRRYGYLLLAGFAAATLSFVWVFLLPLAALSLLLFVGHTYFTTKRKRPPIYFMLIGALLGLTSFFQIYIQMTHPESGGGIDAYGYIPYMPPLYPFIGVILAAGLYVYLHFTSLKLRILYIYGLLTIAFAIGMMVYQVTAFDEVRYYYYKSLHTVVVIAIILVAAIGSRLLQQVLVHRPQKISQAPHTVLVIGTLLVLFGIAFVAVKSPQFDDYYHKRIAGITPEQANTMVDLIAANPINGFRYAPIGSCDRGNDIRAILLAHALAYTPAAYKEPTVVLGLTSSDKQFIYWQINLFLKRHKKDLYVISRDQSLNAGLFDYVGANSRFIHLIDVDPDPPATLLADCPGRLGRQPIPIN